MLFTDQSSPCQQVISRFFPGLDLWVKRDDLLHPQVSGNKFRKLKYPLQALISKEQARHVVSMGGIWSNHLHALAHASHLLGMSSTALVRGATGMHSAMLDDVRALGMQVCFVNRDAYRGLRDDEQAWREYCDRKDAAWLPEGGSAPLALRGVAELIAELPFIPDCLLVACGTGATLAGLLAGLGGRSKVIGIAAISQAEYLRGEISRLLQQAAYPDYQNYELFCNFHHGGYGKAPTILLDFCSDFQQETGIPLEPVYTGKMLFALHKLWQEGYLAKTAKVIAVHTGGLQGARGFALAHPAGQSSTFTKTRA